VRNFSGWEADELDRQVESGSPIPEPQRLSSEGSLAGPEATNESGFPCFPLPISNLLAWLS
jgi:hypothetical protein